MTSICDGWIEILPAEAHGHRLLALPPQPGQVGDVGVDGVDRLDAGRGGRDRAHDARVARDVEVALRARRARAAAPSPPTGPRCPTTRRRSAGWPRATSRMFSSPSGVSVAMSTSLVRAVREAVAVLERGRGCCGDLADVAGVARLGHDVAVGPAGDGVLEVGHAEPGGDRVHAHPALAPAEVQLAEPAAHDGPRGRLEVGRHRVLEVEDEPVGGQGERLGDHPLVAAGHEVQRAPSLAERHVRPTSCASWRCGARA